MLAIEETSESTISAAAMKAPFHFNTPDAPAIIKLADRVLPNDRVKSTVAVSTTVKGALAAAVTQSETEDMPLAV
jgi:hypothetical protein